MCNEVFSLEHRHANVNAECKIIKPRTRSQNGASQIVKFVPLKQKLSYVKKVKKKAAKPTNKPRSPIVTQIRDFHRGLQEMHDELEQNRPIVDDLVVDGLATFRPHFEYSSHNIICYETDYKFHGSNVKLIIYPTRVGRPPGIKKQQRLKTQFHEFSNNLETALEKYPVQLRNLCMHYGLDTADGQTDQSLIENISWGNIKLESLNWIECYTRDNSISKDFDIVIRFKRRIFQKTFRVKTVYFDG